jgi:hypothetical protein
VLNVDGRIWVVSGLRNMDVGSSEWASVMRDAEAVPWSYTDRRLGQWRTQEFFRGGSINSVEDRGQRERGSGGGSP